MGNRKTRGTSVASSIASHATRSPSPSSTAHGRSREPSMAPSEASIASGGTERPTIEITEYEVTETVIETKADDIEDDYTNGEHEMDLTPLPLSEIFPFFFLAFLALGSFFALAAYAADRLKRDYKALPLLLLGVGGMLVSPLIGHWLTLRVKAMARGLAGSGLGGVLVLALAGAVGWQAFAMAGLKDEVNALRSEVVAAHSLINQHTQGQGRWGVADVAEGVKGWFQ